MFWQDYFPQPIIFSFGSLAVRWYGLILVAAIIIAAWYVRKHLAKKSVLSKNKFEDLLFYTIIFGLVGARFGHVVFFNFDYYLNNLGDIIKIWHGGLSIHGALLFGLLTVIYWARKHKINFWRLTDVAVPAVALGQAIGRWGNYFNQELYGRPTTGWWGIPIESANKIAGYQKYYLFHPTFFYEFVLNLILFFILHKLLNKGKLKTGILTLIYFGSYSLIRFLMEFVRIDDTLLVAGLRLPQVISFAVIVLVAALIYVFYTKPLPKLNK